MLVDINLYFIFILNPVKKAADCGPSENALIVRKPDLPDIKLMMEERNKKNQHKQVIATRTFIVDKDTDSNNLSGQYTTKLQFFI